MSCIIFLFCHNRKAPVIPQSVPQITETEEEEVESVHSSESEVSESASSETEEDNEPKRKKRKVPKKSTGKKIAPKKLVPASPEKKTKRMEREKNLIL